MIMGDACVDKETMVRTILMDSRYSRIDPKDYTDEMLDLIYRRIMNENEQRRVLMGRIAAGEDIAAVIDSPGSEALRLTDILEALPGRIGTITDAMAYYGFVENCPIGYLPDGERALIVEALVTGTPLKRDA